jgi:PIN domain nuclease of toxin-antitoxin system
MVLPDSDPVRRQSLLLDTHVLLWLIDGNPLLGRQALQAVDQASLLGSVLVSAITPWEIGMLTSKKRITLHREALEWVCTALSRPGVLLAPLGPEIAVGSNNLPFEMHSDPADRILVATARHLGATLITADRALLEIARQGHFAAMDAAA